MHYMWPSIGAFRALACVYTVIIGALAVLDAHNGLTVPIYAWLLMITGNTAALLFGVAVSGYHLMYHADKKSFVPNAELEGLVEKRGGSSSSKNTEAQKAMLYVGSVTSIATDFVFFSLVFLASLLTWQQVMFVYDYTKSKPGYQAQLDLGFPTGDALYFAPYMKLQLMFSLELQMALAIGICFVSAAVNRATKHQHSA